MMWKLNFVSEAARSQSTLLVQVTGVTETKQGLFLALDGLSRINEFKSINQIWDTLWFKVAVIHASRVAMDNNISLLVGSLLWASWHLLQVIHGSLLTWRPLDFSYSATMRSTFVLVIDNFSDFLSFWLSFSRICCFWPNIWRIDDFTNSLS